MSLLGLTDQVNFLQQQRLQATQYELALWSRVLKPLNYFGMMLLALAIVLGPLRGTGLGPRCARLLVGLSFKYLQDLFAPMSVVFALPPSIAVASTGTVVYLRRLATYSPLRVTSSTRSATRILLMSLTTLAMNFCIAC
ncbi:MAG: hypothetical protein CM15mP120_26470 [Pseudomonadota bacterium]|nr:MAG: hypothetical protein CM15mP120_26470 [Pseudomonadota bacterium]